MQSRIDEIHAAGAEVLAICKDPVEDNARTAENLKLDFSILSDPKLKVTDAYDLLHREVSIDGGDTVVAAMDGLPLGAVITDLEIDGEPHVLTAGTYGRGAWQAALSPLPLFADGFETGDTSRWTLTAD